MTGDSLSKAPVSINRAFLQSTGCWSEASRKGAKERPSTKSANCPPARSVIVGAKSIFAVIWSIVVPGWMPGPHTRSGTWISSSYASIFPEGRLCSPIWNPLSDVKKIYVLSSCPLSSRLFTNSATISSTACMDWTRRVRFFFLENAASIY